MYRGLTIGLLIISPIPSKAADFIALSDILATSKTQIVGAQSATSSANSTNTDVANAASTSIAAALGNSATGSITVVGKISGAIQQSSISEVTAPQEAELASQLATAQAGTRSVGGQATASAIGLSGANTSSWTIRVAPPFVPPPPIGTN